MNIQDWFPLGLTGLISLQSKALSRVFSNITVQKHQLWTNLKFWTKLKRSNAKILVFLIFSLKPALSLSSFTLIKRLFSSSSLSVIRMVIIHISELLMFLPPILILACNSPSPAFLMMCSVYRLNKQGESRQPCHTPFSILNQSVVPYRVLTVASWPTYRFLRRQGRWSAIPVSLSFSQFVMIHTVKGSSIVNETDAFLKFPCFLYYSVNVGNLISSSSSFYKPSSDIWKFLVHIMLKPSMQDFKHDLTSMEDECNCLMVSTFFSTALLGDWDKDWPFPVLWPLLGLPDLLT